MRSTRHISLLLATIWLAPMSYIVRAGEPAGIVVQPVSLTVLESCTATFTVEATGTPPIFLQWLRNDLPLLGETNALLSRRAAFPEDNWARFRVRVSNAFGSVVSEVAVLNVGLDVSPPVLKEAGGDATRTRVFVRFAVGACGGLGLESISAADIFNYSLDGGLIISNATLDASGTLVTLTTSPQTPDRIYTLEVPFMTDARGNSIAPGSTTTFRARAPRGEALLFEAFRRPPCGGQECAFFDWTTNLLAEKFLSAFNSRQAFPNDSSDGYTARISGYFVPPISGNWIFYLRSDDDSRLYLGTGGLGLDGVVKITEEPGCCRPFSANPSPPMALLANVPFYIEGLYRERTGADFLQVAAKLESDPTPPDALPPIPSEYLIPFLDQASGLITIQEQPRDVVVLMSARATFTVAATAPAVNQTFPFPFLHYQWQRHDLDSTDWMDIPGATNASHTTPPKVDCDLEFFRCRLFSAGVTTLSAPAQLTTVVDTSPLQLQNVYAGPSLNEVHVIFSKPVNLESATDPFNYFTDNLLIFFAGLLSPTHVVLFTERQTPGTIYSLVVNSVRDLADPSCGGREITQNTAARFQAWELTRGVARRELYFGIHGPGIDALRSSPKFPSTPDQAGYVRALDGRTELFGLNLADNYGMRISGYLAPDISANYHFYLTSDGPGEFWLSLDDDPANVFLVCNDIGTNGWRQWPGSPFPPGLPRSWSRARFPNGIPLSSPGPHYFEALMKEGVGTDHLGVAWTRAGEPVPAPGSPPIPGDSLLTLAPRIHLRRVGNSLIITWTLGGKLESAPSIAGPWSAEPFLANPWSILLPSSPRFYRVVFGP